MPAAFVAPAGITINSVAPEPVRTRESFRSADVQFRVGIASLTALKRLATSTEVSAGGACVASREAACIMGAAPIINGGIQMH